MQIGVLARAARCSVATIRYYEQVGLIPEPTRTQGNFRTYTNAHVERLRTIRGCRALDLSLDEIRDLLDQVDGDARDCAGVDRMIDDHIADVDARIDALRQLRGQLHALRERCDGTHELEDCGVWTGLSGVEAGAEPA